MDLLIVWETLPQFFAAIPTTLLLTFSSLALGLIMAVPLAVLRLSKNPLLSMPVYGFVLLFRGTPLLVQLFLIYYGSGQFREAFEAVGLWTYFRDAWFCATLALTLNTAAYTTEIIRGGILGVPHGEVEAARACGMSGPLMFRRIVLPKAARIAFPAYTNEVIFLLQATSLVSLVTITDITRVATVTAARSFDFFELYITAAIFYIILVYGLSGIFKRIEHMLSGHLRERPGAESQPAGGATVEGAGSLR